MTCRQANESISDYVDGALAASQEKLIAQHLSTCGECRRYLEQLKTTIQLTRGLADLDVKEKPLPKGLTKAIVAASKNSTRVR